MSDISWEFNTVKIGSLIPWDKNPKMKITQKQSEQITNSINNLGQFQTIAIGPDLEIYDGHQRSKSILDSFGPDYEVTVLQSSRKLTEKEKEQLVLSAHITTVVGIDPVLLRKFSAESVNLAGVSSDVLLRMTGDTQAIKALIASSGYKPALDPGSTTRLVTDVDIQKAKTVESEKFSSSNQDLYTVLCPHCSEEFMIDKFRLK